MIRRGRGGKGGERRGAERSKGKRGVKEKGMVNETLTSV